MVYDIDIHFPNRLVNADCQFAKDIDLAWKKEKGGVTEVLIIAILLCLRKACADIFRELPKVKSKIFRESGTIKSSNRLLSKLLICN